MYLPRWAPNCITSRASYNWTHLFFNSKPEPDRETSNHCKRKQQFCQWSLNICLDFEIYIPPTIDTIELFIYIASPVHVWCQLSWSSAILPVLRLCLAWLLRMRNQLQDVMMIYLADQGYNLGATSRQNQSHEDNRSKCQ